MAEPITLTAPNNTSYSQPTGQFINNEFVTAKSGETIETVNPFDESPIAKVAAAGPEDVDVAVAAARAAFKNPAWRGLSVADRGALLYKLSELCERDKHILATIDAWDNGKPYQVALDEDLAETVAVFKYYGGWADKIYGQTIETSDAKLAYTRHEPIAEQTPLSVLYLGTLIKEAGFPPGVVNIINGYGRTAGAALAEHLGVDKIAFTGSTTTGKAIMKAASVNLKNITLETGGKSPLIVFDDADLDQAVKWSHLGIMGGMGQVCTSTSRIYVQDTIYDKFLDRFKEYTMENTTSGSQFDEKTTHGPQISKVQQEKILSYVESAKSEGGRLLLGGKPGAEKGYFVEPTIFADTKNHMKAVREEIFGPFVVIQSFSSDEDAIEKANDTEYGLGAAVFSRDIVRAHKAAAAIEAGMVWINSSQDSHFGIPFGGYKQSGIGRELGQYALSAYTQVKAIHVNLGTWL
ncbi:hypothetical protein DL769_011432 [Monosporascus sp. CRB-8-3]|nr:hypothetical protein DL769_011432 [Monosporascus sp. CRB-8-3]